MANIRGEVNETLDFTFTLKVSVNTSPFNIIILLCNNSPVLERVFSAVSSNIWHISGPVPALIRGSLKVLIAVKAITWSTKNNENELTKNDNYTNCNFKTSSVKVVALDMSNNS